MPMSEYYRKSFNQHETEIRSFFDDNGLFGDRGNVKGSYLGSLVINAGADPIIIPMYAGTATERTISERLREHAVNFYNDSFKFTGVRPEELKSGKISYSFDLRAETADYDQAKKAESMLILTKSHICSTPVFRSSSSRNTLIMLWIFVSITNGGDRLCSLLCSRLGSERTKRTSSHSRSTAFLMKIRTGESLLLTKHLSRPTF